MLCGDRAKVHLAPFLSLALGLIFISIIVIMVVVVVVVFVVVSEAIVMKQTTLATG